jgi:hypothetical protein
VSPVRYELGFYIPEDDILHSHFRENAKSYTNGNVQIPCNRIFLQLPKGTETLVQAVGTVGVLCYRLSQAYAVPVAALTKALLLEQWTWPGFKITRNPTYPRRT